MNTCKTCKWWLFWNERENPSSILNADIWGSCENPLLESNIEDRHTNGLSASECRQGEVPSTGPDFGCIHWESK